MTREYAVRATRRRWEGMDKGLRTFVQAHNLPIRELRTVGIHEVLLKAEQAPRILLTSRARYVYTCTATVRRDLDSAIAGCDRRWVLVIL